MEAKEIIYAIAMQTRNNREVHRLYMDFINGEKKLIDPFGAKFMNPKEFPSLSYATVNRILSDIPKKQIFFEKWKKRPVFDRVSPPILGNRWQSLRKIDDKNKDNVFIISESKYVDKKEC